MEFGALVKAALELGVIPALALFLVVAMYLQNRQLIKDRHETEKQLLNTLLDVVANQKPRTDASEPRARNVKARDADR
jgi:hypothetical protein